ncbi:MAG: translation elongation factor 4 [Planctomycetota bacterium]
MKHTRNFSIIAHIDHGKSTLADRLMQRTNTVEEREFRDQLLDDMDLERERGITIKARAVTMHTEYRGERYQLNLIDTPGHVDFNYEVLKSMQACEGALLLVDAAQGIEAQTVANALLAEEAKLTIVPVLNKVDLAAARPEEVADEIEQTLCLEKASVLHASAKSGIGIDEIIEAIIERIPPPSGDPKAPLQALIFDSTYNDYRGVVVYMRIVNGSVSAGDKVRMLRTGRTYEVSEVGKFLPAMKATKSLECGEVGYLISNIKELSHIKIGDTITLEETAKTVKPLPGFREPRPMVFCGLYPASSGDFEGLRKALDRLALNDSSFTYQPETSDALGFGFRCGFLGVLHMEIVQERLERESDIDVVQTAPNVTYEILTTDGKTFQIDTPAHLPDPHRLEEIREPYVKVNLIMPSEYIGNILPLCEERRGIYVATEYISASRVMLHYELPLSEIIFDFHDKLKSGTRGYGTMDYELIGYRSGPLVKLRILVGGMEVDALSMIVHRTAADRRGRKVIQKLSGEIPRHMFEVPLQAAIGGKIIARETIKAQRKNVTAKCYGGDITRKRKLLEKQKAGKRRMKQVGNVEIPQKAFLSVLSTDDPR